MGEEYFEIKSFAKGLNEYSTETLVGQDEAVYLRNAIINDGSLKTESVETEKYSIPSGSTIDRIIDFHTADGTLVLLQADEKIYSSDGTLFTTLFNPGAMDYINFHHNGKKAIIGNNGTYPFIINSAGVISFLMNRRPVYKEDGTLDYYTNELGQKLTEEQIKVSRAPAGSLIELFQDRLWVSQVSGLYTTERLYFSTSGINGSDINDWQIPIEEAEANQHGGFIDVRSYDGSGIIGLKSAFDALYVFKKNSVYKIIGTTPDDFQMVQVSESNGTIADRSICFGNNTIFYLSTDGIYSFDGTNSRLISAKVESSIGAFEGYMSESVSSLYHDRKYFLSIPMNPYSTSAKSYLFVYDTDLESYTMHEYGGVINDLKVIENEVCIAIGNKVKTIMSDSVVGAKPLVWETPFYDFGVPNSKKNTTYVYFRAWGKPLDGGTIPSVVRFSLISDRKTKYIDVPLSKDNLIYKKKLKNKGRYFKLKITNPDNCHFELENVRLIAEVDID